MKLGGVSDLQGKRMKITIEIEINGPSADLLAKNLNTLDLLNRPKHKRARFHLRLLLLDALKEFQDRRALPALYVNNRYPDMKQAWKTCMADKVYTRKSIAKALQDNLTVESVDLQEES